MSLWFFVRRFKGKLADKLEDEALFAEFTAQAEQIATLL